MVKVASGALEPSIREFRVSMGVRGRREGTWRPRCFPARPQEKPATAAGFPHCRTVYAARPARSGAVFRPPRGAPETRAAAHPYLGRTPTEVVGMNLALAIVLATAMVCATVLVISFIGLSLAKERRPVCRQCGASIDPPA